jgi:hypothetical protein
VHNELSVAIISGDRVVAASDDPAAVSVAAAMVGASITEPDPVMVPIAEGRRAACRRIAMREIPVVGEVA